MKFYMNTFDVVKVKSHPARGAWIEIHEEALEWGVKTSHPARGAWIEI